MNRRVADSALILYERQGSIVTYVTAVASAEKGARCALIFILGGSLPRQVNDRSPRHEERALGAPFLRFGSKLIKRVQRALFFRFGGKGVYTDVHDRHPQTKKSAICALFINLVVPKAGLEPARGHPSADFESAASAIPPLRQIQFS